jgi:hypothetical protein
LVADEEALEEGMMDEAQYDKLMKYIDKQAEYLDETRNNLIKINAKMSWFVFLSVVAVIVTILF